MAINRRFEKCHSRILCFIKYLFWAGIVSSSELMKHKNFVEKLVEIDLDQ